ncbi:MAG: hypothetical protein GY937_22875 [bacterium]|nr:hypothetical protein [bacterium]
MAHYTGITGAIYVPTGVTDFAAVTFAQIGATDFYTVQQESVRITRAFTDAAVVGDFSPAAGSVVSLQKPIGVIEISGAGATVAVTSSNSRVYTMAKVGGFHEFRLTTAMELIDVTEFEDAFAQFEKSVIGWSAVCQRHWQDENLSLNVAATMKAIDDGHFPVELFIARGSGLRQRYVGNAYIEEYALAGPRSGQVTEATITMRGDGQLWYRNQDN